MADAGSNAGDEIYDLSNPDVTTKYRAAADIANKALQKVLDSCIDGADICTLCELGDAVMFEETGKLYNKKVKDGDKEKTIVKGVAFPTCISVNEFVGHFSPLKGESRILKIGDIVKVDLSCHIDGFVAGVAHTVVVGQQEVQGRAADVVHAAWNAAEGALRLMKVGNTNQQVTEVFKKATAEFDCTPVQGVRSHQLKRHVIDGNRNILSIETADDKNEKIEFELNEVYCLDVVVSTGNGKAREAELRSTVYKRAVDTSYSLKTQKARQFISEVDRRFPALPFSLRHIEDEQVARVGASEARRHELLAEYPVLKEKESQIVAQFKFTVLMLPGGTKKITGLPFVGDKQFKSKYEVKDEDLKKLLATSANPKKNKKKAAKGEKEPEA